MCRARRHGAQTTYHITAPSALAVYVWMGAASCSVTPPCVTPSDACPPAENASCVKRVHQPTANAQATQGPALKRRGASTRGEN